MKEIEKSKIVSKREIEKIHENSIKILEKTGVYVYSEGPLKIFSENIMKNRNEFNSARFGNLIIKIDNIEDLFLDIIFVCDLDYSEQLPKLFKIIKDLILEHQFLFIVWDGIKMSDFSLLEESLLKQNEILAESNRVTLDTNHIHAIDILGSIGSGKTTLIQQLVKN